MKLDEISAFIKTVIDTLEKFAVKEIHFDLGIDGGTRIKFTIIESEEK